MSLILYFYYIISSFTSRILSVKSRFIRTIHILFGMNKPF